MTDIAEMKIADLNTAREIVHELRVVRAIHRKVSQGALLNGTRLPACGSQTAPRDIAHAILEQMEEQLISRAAAIGLDVSDFEDA